MQHHTLQYYHNDLSTVYLGRYLIDFTISFLSFEVYVQYALSTFALSTKRIYSTRTPYAHIFNVNRTSLSVPSQGSRLGTISVAVCQLYCYSILIATPCVQCQSTPSQLTGLEGCSQEANRIETPTIQERLQPRLGR